MVLSTLEKLSRGSEALDKAYENAIERIKGQLPNDRAIATNVLSWIIHSQRLLTTEELCHALAVKPDNKELDLDNILDVEDIVSVCAGLVTVDEDSNVIRLVHYTTQKYFKKVQEEWNHCPQLKIASTCLTYLSFGVFQSGGCLAGEDFTSRLIQYPFLVYAARHWGLHILTVQEEMSNQAYSFLQSSSFVSSATQVMSTNDDYNFGDLSQICPKNTTGLHLAVQFGLVYISNFFLSI